MKPEKHYLSKSTYIRGLQCEKSLYLYKKRYFLKDPVSPEQMAKFNRGNEVGLLARELFPGGIDVSPKNPFQYQKSVSETAELILRGEARILYEPAFQFRRVLAAMDILINEEDGWVAYEVKSSLKISPTYREDVALQYFVITSSGLPLKDIRLLHLNPDYRLTENLNIDALFTWESLLDFAKGRRHFIENRIESLLKINELKSSPLIPIGARCHQPYPCDFIGHCWKNVPPKSVLDLSELSLEERFSLYDEGIISPAQIVDIEGFTPIQFLQIKVRSTGIDHLNTDLLEVFKSSLKRRNGILSLINSKPAVPIFAGYGAFQPILAAYSISGIEDIGTMTTQFEPEVNTPLDFLRALIDNCELYDTIIVESAKDTILFFNHLANNHPSERERLELLNKRFIGITDLVASGGWYPANLTHPYSAINIARAVFKDKVKDVITAKIDNSNLAGEIYRQLVISGTQLKSFTMKDLRDFMTAQRNSLQLLTNHILTI